MSRTILQYALTFAAGVAVGALLGILSLSNGQTAVSVDINKKRLEVNRGDEPQRACLAENRKLREQCIALTEGKSSLAEAKEVLASALVPEKLVVRRGEAALIEPTGIFFHLEYCKDESSAFLKTNFRNPESDPFGRTVHRGYWFRDKMKVAGTTYRVTVDEINGCDDLSLRFSKQVQ